MFTASIMALLISTSGPLKAMECQKISSSATPVRVQLIAEYDPKDDPGKDLTRDPHDENHDKDLPANNPDEYLSGETYPQTDGD